MDRAQRGGLPTQAAKFQAAKFQAVKSSATKSSAAKSSGSDVGKPLIARLGSRITRIFFDLALELQRGSDGGYPDRAITAIEICVGTSLRLGGSRILLGHLSSSILPSWIIEPSPARRSVLQRAMHGSELRLKCAANRLLS
jgi:hypothetical protein